MSMRNLSDAWLPADGLLNFARHGPQQICRCKIAANGTVCLLPPLLASDQMKRKMPMNKSPKAILTHDYELDAPKVVCNDSSTERAKSINEIVRVLKTGVWPD
jgi:hypothetical protein